MIEQQTASPLYKTGGSLMRALVLNRGLMLIIELSDPDGILDVLR
ncbi:hypothetical protein ADIAL_0676 [Alkalibacterium sp. AK22]|nr:hypothetical protein ADIAL_0676 [Alkalibacterium sp. AK22]